MVINYVLSKMGNPLIGFFLVYIRRQKVLSPLFKTFKGKVVKVYLFSKNEMCLKNFIMNFHTIVYNMLLLFLILCTT